MNLKNYKILVSLLSLAALAYVVHKTVFYTFSINDADFRYSLEKLYLLFSGMSMLVFVVLLKVRERSFDNVGMSFLLATSVKMVFCYLILRPILQVSDHNIRIEKTNFFVLFILFLAIETLLTIRLLSKKQ